MGPLSQTAAERNVRDLAETSLGIASFEDMDLGEGHVESPLLIVTLSRSTCAISGFSRLLGRLSTSVGFTRRMDMACINMYPHTILMRGGTAPHSGCDMVRPATPAQACPAITCSTDTPAWVSHPRISAKMCPTLCANASVMGFAHAKSDVFQFILVRPRVSLRTTSHGLSPVLPGSRLGLIIRTSVYP
jgi:hypothetical protein